MWVPLFLFCFTTFRCVITQTAPYCKKWSLHDHTARHSGDDPGDGRRGWGFDNVGDTSWSLGVARSQTPRPTPVLARIYGVRPTLFKELDMICTSLPSASAVRGRILCLQMRNENQRVASTVTCTAKVLSLDVT